MLDRVPNILLVAIGGVFGALTRYSVGQLISSNKFPLATLFVNLIGSFLLGFIVGMHEQDKIADPWVILLGVGFMGSLTTMSSFAVETINTGAPIVSTANIVITLTGVLIGAVLGKVLALLIVS